MEETPHPWLVGIEPWDIHTDEDYRDLPLPSRWAPEPVRATYEDRRELKIAAGECGMPACPGVLDEDFFCVLCGQVSLPARLEPAPETPVELPQPELPVDEFAPAEVDAA